jgi:hypothetical protein
LIWKPYFNYVLAPGLDPRGQGGTDKVWKAFTVATIRLGKIFITKML